MEIQNQNQQECFLRAICIFCERFSGSHYKHRLFISLSETHANQVVAQTNPGRRTWFIQTQAPPTTAPPSFISHGANGASAVKTNPAAMAAEQRRASTSSDLDGESKLGRPTVTAVCEVGLGRILSWANPRRNVWFLLFGELFCTFLCALQNDRKKKQ